MTGEICHVFEGSSFEINEELREFLEKRPDLEILDTQFRFGYESVDEEDFSEAIWGLFVIFRKIS